MYEYYHHEEMDRQRQIGLPSFFQQFLPPFGQPPVQPGPPSGAPPGQVSGPPSGAPPAFIPSLAQAQSLTQPSGVGVLAVDPGAIRPCLFRFVYLWLTTGEQFWAWLVFVGPRSVAGWRWTGFRWIYFGVDLRNIRSFYCF